MCAEGISHVGVLAGIALADLFERIDVPMIVDDTSARLTLGSGDEAGTGTWWPRSRNLRGELPALLRALWSGGHDIHRVTYNPQAWNTSTRAIAVSGRYVKLEARGTQEPHAVVLIDNSGWKRLVLHVTPPD
jgi:hypothetical protein